MKLLKQIELLIRKTTLVLFRVLKQRPKSDISKLAPAELAAHLRSARSILFLRQDRLGDVMMSTFLFRELHALMPDAQLSILLSNNNREVVPLLPTECEILIYQKKPLADLRMLRELRRRKIDIVIDLTDKASVTSTFFVSMIGAKLSIGVEKENGAAYTLTVPRPNQATVHISKRIGEFLRPFGIDPDSITMKPSLSISRELVKGRVGLNISAGSLDRQIPTRVAIEIIKGIYQYRVQLDLREIVVFHSSRDERRALDVVQACSDLFRSPKFRFVSAAGNYPQFAKFAARIGTCEYLITGDTSVIQIAASLEIPILLLFKPMPGEHPWTPVGTPFELLMGRPDLEHLESEEAVRLFQKLVHSIARSETISSASVL